MEVPRGTCLLRMDGGMDGCFLVMREVRKLAGRLAVPCSAVVSGVGVRRGRWYCFGPARRRRGDGITDLPPSAVPRSPTAHARAHFRHRIASHHHHYPPTALPHHRRLTRQTTTDHPPPAARVRRPTLNSGK